MRIYCDHAATTATDPEVVDAILPFLTTGYGNPSSSHWAGRKAKEAVAASRETVAQLLGADPSEIFFTSGATEADYLALTGAIVAHDISHVITSRIEHKAVLQTLKKQEREGNIEISYVKLDERGNVDLYHLENLLRSNPRSLISLMHANNEIGNVTDIHSVGTLAARYDAIFHSDTTQTVGKIKLDLATTPVDLAVGSAHKFNGMKGTGFIYIKKGLRIAPVVSGGGQEGGVRGGTENVAGIVGLARALELADRRMAESHERILALKQHLIGALGSIDGISYNGESKSFENSLPHVLHASFPCLQSGNIVSYLDSEGIAVSGGSACSSGGASHVMAALPAQPDKEHVRFSFGRSNTFAQMDLIAEKLSALYATSHLRDSALNLFLKQGAA